MTAHSIQVRGVCSIQTPAWPCFCMTSTAQSLCRNSAGHDQTGATTVTTTKRIISTMRTSLYVIHLLPLALKGSEAFVSAPSLLRPWRPCGESCALKNQPQQQPRKRRRQNCPPVLHALGNSEDSDDNNSGDDDNKESDDHDASFYADLREAKNEKLGAPIPDNYFAALAAIDSENEFLNAMKNAKAEFAEAKAETGSVDGAVERIMDGIRKEEELEAAWDAAAGREEEEEKRQNNSGSDDEDDSDDAFQ